MNQQTDAPAMEVLNPGPRIFGLGSIALAGLLGGPIAVGILVASNFRALRLRKYAWLATVLFVLAAASWLYIALHVPPDLLSQFIPLVPQVFLWWLGARLLLGHAHARHAATGGEYRSVWIAVGLALLISVTLKLLLLL